MVCVGLSKAYNSEIRNAMASVPFKDLIMATSSLWLISLTWLHLPNLCFMYGHGREEEEEEAAI